MHELSIAESIIDIVNENTKQHPDKKVNKITLDIGVLSGVIPEALTFAFEELLKHSPYKNAMIEMNHIKAKAVCHQCKFIFEPNDIFTPCPACHSSDIELIEGKELNVRSIIIE